MGARFDKWLARPTTLQFLRRLLTETESHHSLPPQHGNAFATNRCRRQHYTQATTTVNEEDRGNNDRKTHHEQKFVRMGHGFLNPTELGLVMSVNAGLPMVDQNIEPRSTFNELKIQADVNSEAKLGKLLVDDPEHRGNMKLWIEILHLRQRLDGIDGVIDVWRGMRRRGVDLPVSGAEAQILWPTFIYASANYWTAFLEEVYEYAKDLRQRTGEHYGGLYKCIAGRRLRVWYNHKWHDRLTNDGFRPADALKSVCVDAMQSVDRVRALRVFRRMYANSEERDLYDSCIFHAFSDTDPDEGMALRWHQLFLAYGDGPSQEVFVQPQIQRLFELDGDASLPMKTVKPPKVPPVKQDPSAYPRLDRATMSSLVGDVHGIKPKELSDTFCAKMFATRAFSMSLVVRGLWFFGIEILGPIALREMALKAGSVTDFNEQISGLKQHGIKLSSDPFSNLLVRISSDGEVELWEALLNWDIHHSVFSEVETLSRLLASGLRQEKYAQAHLTLLALSLLGSEPSVEAWNVILRHYLRGQAHRPLLNTLQAMQTQRIPIWDRTLIMLVAYLLPPRRPSKRPDYGAWKGFFDPHRVVTNVLIHAAKTRPPPTYLWPEILKRYGMRHKFGELERLVGWLFEYYSTPSTNSYLNEPRRARFQRERLIHQRWFVLRQIFDTRMKKAIFDWGFRSAAVRKQLLPYPATPGRVTNEFNGPVGLVEYTPAAHFNPQPWAQGLVLLRRLGERYGGVPIATSEVRKAFMHRMWVLFGPAYSVLRINHDARRENRLTLAQYVRHAQDVWPGIANHVDPELLKPEREGDPALLEQFFGATKSAGNKDEGAFVDVRAWSRALAVTGRKGHFIAEPKGVLRKRQMWQANPLRLTSSPSPQTATKETLSNARPNQVKNGAYKPTLLGEANEDRENQGGGEMHWQTATPEISSSARFDQVEDGTYKPMVPIDEDEGGEEGGREGGGEVHLQAAAKGVLSGSRLDQVEDGMYKPILPNMANGDGKEEGGGGREVHQRTANEEIFSNAHPDQGGQDSMYVTLQPILPIEAEEGEEEGRGRREVY